MNYPHILSRVMNRPLLVTPDYLQLALSSIAPRLDLQIAKPEATVYDPDKEYQRGDHYLVRDGLAYIDIRGGLVSRTASLRPFSGMTGYNGIFERLEYALGDPKVNGIVLDLDSPGGEVTGLFDLVDYMQTNRGKKPTYSLISGSACSACFAIAAQTDMRLITQNSYTGSVGVVIAHKSLAGKLDKDGIKMTLIHAGAHKVDANPYQDLSDEVKAELQQAVNDTYDTFVKAVSDGIGLSVEAVKATEARVYSANAAIAIGFADQLVNGHQAHQFILDDLSKRADKPTNGVIHMSNNTPAQNAGDSPTPAPVAEVAPTAGDVRQRVKGILALSQAAQSPSLAQAIALDTDLDVEQASALLDAAGKDLEAATPAPAEQASEQEPSRDAGADFDKAVAQAQVAPTEAETAGAGAAQGNRLLAAYRGLTGKQPG